MNGSGEEQVNAHSTVPLPAVPVTDIEHLIAISERVLAALAEDRQLLLQIRDGRGDLMELVGRDNRIADAQGDWRDGIAKIAKASAARSVLDLIEEEASAPSLSAVPDAPRHRHRKGRVPRPRAPGEHPLLNSVKGYAPVAAFLALLKRAAPHLRHLGHAVTAAKGAAHAHRIAAALTAVTLAGAGAGAGAELIQIGTAQSPYGASAGPGASVPGWHTSATPIPSSSPIALAVTHPKAKHGSKEGKTLLYATAPPPYSAAAQDPASTPAGASASSAASVAAGPAVLSVGTDAIDLTNVTSATVTLTASGSGWVSWHITTSGTDLDFSATHGVLQAGQSVQVTVSLDPSQDGLSSQTFEIAGQQVTVTLPGPAPDPSATPSAGVTTDPTAPPSGASSSLPD
jgi:hypothetical protein